MEKVSGKIWKRNPRDSDHSMEGELKLSEEKRRGRDDGGSINNLMAIDDNDRSKRRVVAQMVDRVASPTNRALREQ